MSIFWQSLLLYLWPVVLATVVSPTLSILGSLLVARERVLHLFCAIQSAALGILLGITLSHFLGDFGMSFIPLILGMAASFLSLAFLDFLTDYSSVSKQGLLLSAYAVLLALTHLFIAAIPELENHQVQVFLGDIVTLSSIQAAVGTILGIVALFWLSQNYRKMVLNTFQISLYGKASQVPFLREEQIWKWLTLACLVLSVFFLGMLFTIGAFFIPTCLHALLSSRKSLRAHAIFIAVVSSTASLMGFLISLVSSWLPTAPAIVICLVIVSLLALGLSRFWPVGTPS